MKGNEGKKESVKSAQGFQIPIPSIHQNLWTVRPAVRNSVRKSVRPSVSIRVRAPKSRNIPWVGQQRQRWGHIKAKLDLNVRRGRHWPANGQTLKSCIPPPASPSLKILGYLATAEAYWIGKLNGYNHSIASYKCIITPRNGKVGVHRARLFGYGPSQSRTESVATSPATQNVLTRRLKRVLLAKWVEAIRASRAACQKFLFLFCFWFWFPFPAMIVFRVAKGPKSKYDTIF